MNKAEGGSWRLADSARTMNIGLYATAYCTRSHGSCSSAKTGTPKGLYNVHIHFNIAEFIA
eukprot:6179045-Pleurochrysis_carterae.AAC.6